MNFLRTAIFLGVVLSFGTALDAQFKEIGPAPLPPAAARQKIRTLLDRANPENSRETVATISGLLVWYRDLFDEELIAAWQKGGRANLPELIKPLADARVASAIVEFSWRQQRAATFNLAYAPMLEDLMARYPESARPFLEDLRKTPQLSQSEAESVCRILVDMPDTEVWKNSARQILPEYRQAAESLLNRDARGDDQEKAYRAQVWMGELGMNGGRPTRDPTAPSLSRRVHVDGSHPVVEPDAPRTAAAAPVSSLAAPVQAPSRYAGQKSGMLECSGRDIPQNGEYVFTDLPPGKLQLDYDTKTWDSRLLPGTGNSQRLILINKRPGTQKRCSVRWSVVP